MTLSELRALAERATPGQWQVGVDGFPVGAFSTGNSGEDGRDYCVSTNARSDQLCSSQADAKNDAAYIAAANPAVVLELLERLEAMEKALVAYGVCGCRGKPYKCLLCSSLAHHGSAVPLKGEK